MEYEKWNYGFFTETLMFSVRRVHKTSRLPEVAPFLPDSTLEYVSRCSFKYIEFQYLSNTSVLFNQKYGDLTYSLYDTNKLLSYTILSVFHLLSLEARYDYKIR